MKFVFLFTKPKGEQIAETFAEGARSLGHPTRIITGGGVGDEEVLVVYGVLDKTRALFKKKRRQGRAIYLDNGWVTSKATPTLRWCWNGVQPHYADLPRAMYQNSLIAPVGRSDVQEDEALVCFQSKEFFDHLGLSYSQAEWVASVSQRLGNLGYKVTVRHKPTRAHPEHETLDSQLSRVGLVISLSSAITLKALAAGVPAFCTLHCALSECAPAYLPEIGKAIMPSKEKIEELISTLHGCDMTYEELQNGTAVQKILDVPANKRRGFFYG